jgi:hypothetical protein
MTSFTNAIVRILSRDQQTICGTGFLIPAGYLLTCAHVASEALGHPPETVTAAQQQERLLHFQLAFSAAASPYRARLEYCNTDPDRDLAVLKVLSPRSLPSEIRPLRLKKIAHFLDHRYRVFGFRSREGLWVTGQLLDRVANGHVQMNSDPTSWEAVQPGFSGAPVWDEQEKACVGMVVAVVPSSSSGPPRIAAMIPTDKLCEIWPPLERHILHPRPKPEPRSAPVTEVADPHVAEQWERGAVVVIKGERYLLARAQQAAGGDYDPAIEERYYSAQPLDLHDRGVPIRPVLIRQLVLRTPVYRGQERLLQPLREEGALLRQLRHPAFPRWLDEEELARSFTLIYSAQTGIPLTERFPFLQTTQQATPDQAAALLLRGEPLDALQARGLLMTIPRLCEALAELHRLGHTHRNLCGETLLLGKDKRGYAELCLRDPGRATWPPREGEGPALYRAPEQQWAGEPTAATDIYQLGSLLYHLLTGQVASSSLYGPERPSLLNALLPPTLDEVLLRAIHAKPEARWSDMRAFAWAIQQVLQQWT